MIGTKMRFATWNETVDELAHHVLHYTRRNDLNVWQAKRVEMIVSNALSYLEVRSLTPRAFSEFCGAIAEKIDEIERNAAS